MFCLNILFRFTEGGTPSALRHLRSAFPSPSRLVQQSSVFSRFPLLKTFSCSPGAAQLFVLSSPPTLANSVLRESWGWLLFSPPSRGTVCLLPACSVQQMEAEEKPSTTTLGFMWLPETWGGERTPRGSSEFRTRTCWWVMMTKRFDLSAPPPTPCHFAAASPIIIACMGSP